MKARAEPQPLKQFRDDRQLQFYAAIVELFYLTQEPQILQLIDSLEKMDYEVEELSDTAIEMLKEAFNQALVELDNGTEDAEEQTKRLKEGQSILHDMSTVSMPTTPAPSRHRPSEGN
jgi:hypothetical protein